MSVHSSTQHPSETQESLRVSWVCGVMRSPWSARMGGASAARKCRPALRGRCGPWRLEDASARHVRLTRQLDMTLTGKRHPYLARYRAGFRTDGPIRRCRSRYIPTADGASICRSRSCGARCSTATTRIACPHVEVTGRVCRTNKTSQTAIRGFGGPQGMLGHRRDPLAAAERLPAGGCASVSATSTEAVTRRTTGRKWTTRSG